MVAELLGFVFVSVISILIFLILDDFKVSYSFFNSIYLFCKVSNSFLRLTYSGIVNKIDLRRSITLLLLLTVLK